MNYEDKLAITYRVGDLTDLRPDDPRFTNEDAARRKIVEMDESKPHMSIIYGLWLDEGENMLPDLIAVYYEGNWYSKD